MVILSNADDTTAYSRHPFYMDARGRLGLCLSKKAKFETHGEQGTDNETLFHDGSQLFTWYRFRGERLNADDHTGACGELRRTTPKTW